MNKIEFFVAVAEAYQQYRDTRDRFDWCQDDRQARALDQKREKLKARLIWLIGGLLEEKAHARTAAKLLIQEALLRERKKSGVATCRGCGCRDDRACPGGCAWSTVDRKKQTGVCTNCVRPKGRKRK